MPCFVTKCFGGVKTNQTKTLVAVFIQYTFRNAFSVLPKLPSLTHPIQQHDRISITVGAPQQSLVMRNQGKDTQQRQAERERKREGWAEREIEGWGGERESGG